MGTSPRDVFVSSTRGALEGGIVCTPGSGVAGRVCIAEDLEICWGQLGVARSGGGRGAVEVLFVHLGIGFVLALVLVWCFLVEGCQFVVINLLAFCSSS